MPKIELRWKTSIVHYLMCAGCRHDEGDGEGMRGLLYKVGHLIDRAEHETDSAKKEHAQGLADLLTPVCKAFCSDKGFEVVTLAMQVYGGYGYIAEYPIEQMLRDVKISSIYEGTNGIQALDLIGRKMAMKNGEVFRGFYDELQAFVSVCGASHPAGGIRFFQTGARTRGAGGDEAFEIAGGDREYPSRRCPSFR
jgi:hypothetical protein